MTEKVFYTYDANGFMCSKNFSTMYLFVFKGIKFLFENVDLNIG